MGRKEAGNVGQVQDVAANTRDAGDLTDDASCPDHETHTPVVCNELLCYVFNKMDLLVHDTLVKLCTDFYGSREIEAAKMKIFSCSAISETGVRMIKRQGPSKDKANMEDILHILHKCIPQSSLLPKFVACELSRLPPLDVCNIDFAFLIHEFQGMRAEMSSMREEIKLCKQSNISQSVWANRSTNVTKPVPLVVDLPPVPTDEAVKPALPHRRKKDLSPKAPSAGATVTTSMNGVTVDSPCGAEESKTSGSFLVASSTAVSKQNESFTVVEKKKRSARNKHSTVIGTRNDSTLKARPGRFLTMFVSRLDPCMSPSEFEQYIKCTLNVTAKCTQLETKHDTYASFKVEAMCDNTSNFYDPQRWPAGVYIRKFYFRKS